jgi:hypothetical protein
MNVVCYGTCSFSGPRGLGYLTSAVRRMTCGTLVWEMRGNQVKVHSPFNKNCSNLLVSVIVFIALRSHVHTQDRDCLSETEHVSTKGRA